MGEASPGLYRGRKDLAGLLHSDPQHPSKGLIGGGDLRLVLPQGSSHILTDRIVSSIAFY